MLIYLMESFESLKLKDCRIYGFASVLQEANKGMDIVLQMAQAIHQIQPTGPYPINLIPIVQ